MLSGQRRAAATLRYIVLPLRRCCRHAEIVHASFHARSQDPVRPLPRPPRPHALGAPQMLDVSSETHAYDTASRLELPGHRADVRAVALAADDSQLLTASSSALKLWNPRTGQCLATMDSGYGLSVLFAPGNKFAVLGTKVRHRASCVWTAWECGHRRGGGRGGGNL